MIIKKVDIWRLKLPFRYPFKHKLATHVGSENLVVRVTADNGIAGYGEGIPRTFVTGESMPETFTFLTQTLGPKLLQASFAAPAELAEAVALMQSDTGSEEHPAAFCAAETALFDAAGQYWGKSLSELIGGATRKGVCYSAVVPLGSPEQLPRFFKMVKAKGMRFLKLKVGEAHDLEVLEMARKELGWLIDIRVDANGAWTAPEAVARVHEMLPYGIRAVEQPVPKDDVEGLGYVSRALEIPVIADESLCSEADARKLIASKACDMFNIRLAKCGGLIAALKIRDLAQEAGIACMLGCHVGETSILAAAGRHFALCSPRLVYVEGSFAPYLLAEDPVEPPVEFNHEGFGPILPGPGLGIKVKAETLAELAVSHVRLA
ncbi:MAG: dipeptide epimerase [Deltaproteobacteria bacterium]|nr:dipeptide epimerase [Deltaproteobacteria bacterium]